MWYPISEETQLLEKKMTIEFEEIFKRVNRIEVDRRWFYDIGAYQYEQLMKNAEIYPELKTAAEQSLQMSHWYGASYLVPVDVIDRIRNHY